MKDYDFSTKPFEVLCKEYRFDKYSRKIKANIENEAKYPHSKPTITIKRYRFIKRENIG